MTAAAPVSHDGPLAMICGGGSLPLAVADYVAARGRKVVLFPLRGAAEGTAVERFPHHWLHAGQIGKFMRLARAAGCRDVVFIGALIRPSIWQTRPDFKAICLLPQVLAAFRGADDHLLSGIGRLLESDGFRLRGAHEVAPEILTPEGVLGRVQPSDLDHADIALGLAYLQAAGPYDIAHVEFSATSVATNRVATSAFRAAGRAPYLAGLERVVDLYATHIGLDPAEVRRRNLLRAEELPWTNATGLTYDSGD